MPFTFQTLLRLPLRTLETNFSGELFLIRRWLRSGIRLGIMTRLNFSLMTRKSVRDDLNLKDRYCILYRDTCFVIYC